MGAFCLLAYFLSFLQVFDVVFDCVKHLNSLHSMLIIVWICTKLCFEFVVSSSELCSEFFSLLYSTVIVLSIRTDIFNRIFFQKVIDVLRNSQSFNLQLIYVYHNFS